jgi:hypothetical protein
MDRSELVVMLELVVGDASADGDGLVVIHGDRSELFEPADVDEKVDPGCPELEKTDQALTPGKGPGIVAVGECLDGFPHRVWSVVVNCG